MKKYLWDEEIDYDSEDLSRSLRQVSAKFTKTMLKTVAYSPDDESRELITPHCMKRFDGIAGILADIVQNCENCQSKDPLHEDQFAQRLNGWILLGSLMEWVMDSIPDAPDEEYCW